MAPPLVSPGLAPAAACGVTHMAGSGADCWLGALLLILAVLIPWEADPASFHGDPDSVSGTKAEAIRPLKA